MRGHPRERIGLHALDIRVQLDPMVHQRKNP